MQYRPLGNTGLSTSAISLGSWWNVHDAMDTTAYERLIAAAFAHGVNYFDTADCYARGQAETQLGMALRPLPRSDYLVSTKCFFPVSGAPTNRGLSRKHIVESVHASLRRLGLEHIDVMICHRYDEATPLAETVRTMEDLIRQGKILYWGVSRWDPAQLDAAVRLCTPGYAPVLVQSSYNLLNRAEQPALQWCARTGASFFAYSPLAQGILTGKYGQGAPAGSRATDEKKRSLMHDLTEDGLRAAARLAPVADALGMPMSALALAWCLHQPGMASALCGATSEAQLMQNLQGAELALDAAALTRIEQALHG